MSSELRVDGLIWRGWQEITCTRSLDAVFAEARLKLTRSWPEPDGRVSPPPIRRGQTCQFALEGVAVITGVVVSHSLKADAEGFDLELLIRDRSWLLTQGCVLRKPAEWLGAEAQQIIADICRPYGVPVARGAPPGEPLKKFTVQPGETALRAIERVCRHRALLFFADRTGGLLLSSAAHAARAGDLVFGPSGRGNHGADRDNGRGNSNSGNVLSLNNAATLEGRASEYLVRSQEQESSWGAGENTKREGRARDHGFPLYCPRIVIADEPGTNAELEEMAITLAAVNAGRAQSRDYTVAGWQDRNGQLWDINRLSRVRDITEQASPVDLLIRQCVYRLTPESAAETTLSLVPASAYALREEPQENETNSLWGAEG